MNYTFVQAVSFACDDVAAAVVVVVVVEGGLGLGQRQASVPGDLLPWGGRGVKVHLPPHHCPNTPPQFQSGVGRVR